MAVALDEAVLLTAALGAARSWLEPGRPGHEHAMELLVRAVIALDQERVVLGEQGEDGSG